MTSAILNERWKQLRSRPADAGLTLVECLVSLTAVTLVGLLLGPPLLIAGATQHQSRRIAQAQAIAQGELDRLRRDRAAAAALPTSTAATLQQQPPPQRIDGLRSANPRCHTDRATVEQAIGIDLDGDADCRPEFILQALQRSSAKGALPEVLVRVYGVSSQAGALPPDLQTDLAPVRLSSGVSRRRPLAIATATLSSTPASLLCYHSRCAP
ncbi:MAG: hypothetical protein AAF289_20180 [Cyanobacteria bacterium P01_A01_bin.135]